VAVDTIFSKFFDYEIAFFNRGALSWVLSLDKQRKYRKDNNNPSFSHIKNATIVA